MSFGQVHNNHWLQLVEVFRCLLSTAPRTHCVSVNWTRVRAFSFCNQLFESTADIGSRCRRELNCCISDSETIKCKKIVIVIHLLVHARLRQSAVCSPHDIVQQRNIHKFVYNFTCKLNKSRSQNRMIFISWNARTDQQDNEKPRKMMLPIEQFEGEGTICSSRKRMKFSNNLYY